MAVCGLGAVSMDDVQPHPPHEARHPPGVKGVERKVPVGMICPEEMDCHALDFAVKVARSPVCLGDNLNVQSRRLLREGVVQHPAARMLPDASLFRMSVGDGHIAKMNYMHGWTGK